MGAGIGKTSDELKLNKPLSNFLYLNQKKAKKPKYLAKSQVSYQLVKQTFNPRSVKIMLGIEKHQISNVTFYDTVKISTDILHCKHGKLITRKLLPWGVDDD